MEVAGFSRALKLRGRGERGVWEQAVMARGLGWLYIAGAVIGSVSLMLPRAPGTDLGALELNILLAFSGGVTVLVFFPRLPRWTFHVALLAGTALITRAIYYSGEGVSYYGVWYLWAALFGFSFFKRSQAVAQVGVAGAAYAVVLAIRHEPGGEARWVTTIASLLIAGVFIDALVRRVRAQHNSAVQSAESLAAVVDAMQRIFQHPTAEATRADLCSTALQVTRADSVTLWEPQTDGRLARSATASKETARRMLYARETDPGAELAYASGEARFEHLDVTGEADAVASRRFGCARWQPVVRDERPVGVLAVYWLDPADPLQEHVASTVGLLAAQAAIAIERAELLARLERVARTDELTGLPNRRAWEETLPREMARAAREQWPLCVAMLDVDGLKRVNDTYGHHAGDQLLKQNAAAWNSTMRQVDMLARYGGDEFAAIFTGCDLDDAQRIVERLTDATPDSHTFSVGVAEWDGVKSAQELVAQADGILYTAKNQRPDVRARSESPR